MSNKREVLHFGQGENTLEHVKYINDINKIESVLTEIKNKITLLNLYKSKLNEGDKLQLEIVNEIENLNKTNDHCIDLCSSYRGRHQSREGNGYED